MSCRVVAFYCLENKPMMKEKGMMEWKFSVFLVKIPVMQMTGSSSSSVVTDSPKAYKSLFYRW